MVVKEKMKGKIIKVNTGLFKHSTKILPSGKAVEIYRKECTLTNIYKRMVKYETICIYNKKH